jgi:hypothetical protein
VRCTGLQRFHLTGAPTQQPNGLWVAAAAMTAMAGLLAVDAATAFAAGFRPGIYGVAMAAGAAAVGAAMLAGRTRVLPPMCVAQQIERANDPFVAERVDDVRATSFRHDHSTLAQNFQMARDRRLRQCQNFGELHHVLRTFGERVQNRDPFGVGQAAADFSVQPIDFLNESLIHLCF